MNFGKSIVFSCFVAALVFAVAASASAQNIVANPGFETGDLTSWEVAGGNANAFVTVVADNGPSAPGTSCAFLQNFSEAVGLTMKQPTAVGSAGEGTCYYSFDLKLGQAELGGVFFVEIFAEQEGVGIIGTSGLLGNFAPADWTNIQGNFATPIGTDFLTIQFTAVTGAVVGGSSTMYVDNVSLDYRGTIPAPEMSFGAMKAQH
jgi:hypothetical protein